MDNINDKYLEYLRVNAIEASKHNILDTFINVLNSKGILKSFKYYLNSHSRNENIIVLNRINELENKINLEVDFVRNGR